MCKGRSLREKLLDYRDKPSAASNQRFLVTLGGHTYKVQEIKTRCVHICNFSIPAEKLRASGLKTFKVVELVCSDQCV